MGIDDSFDFQAGRPMKLPPMPPREEFPFLISEHAFDSRTLDEQGSQRDPAALCLSFQRGEFAYVHSVHASGWGDVTLSRSGERGWVPIDYFTTFRDARAIPLLAAIAAFLAQPRSMKRPIGIIPVNGNRNVSSGSTASTGSSNSGISSSQSDWTFSDAAINEIISGTKLLLSKCGVVSRDAPLVVRTPSIIAARKALLVDLAHIVRVAKQNMYATDPKIIDKLVRACHRLLERMRILLVTLDEEEYESQLREQREPDLRDGRSIHSSIRSNRRESGRSSFSYTGSVKSGRSNRSIGWGETSPQSASQQTSSMSGGSGSTDATSAISLLRIRSFNDHEHIPSMEERIREVSFAFGNYLSKFIDPTELLASPEDPQTSPAILALTRHCMLACRELLVVLDVPTDGFDAVKDGLLDEIRRLVSAARSVVASLPPTPASLRGVAVHHLALVASKCLKLCQSACKSMLHKLQENPSMKLPERAYPIFDNMHGNRYESVETLSSKISPPLSPGLSPQTSPHTSPQTSPQTKDNVETSKLKEETPKSHKPFQASELTPSRLRPRAKKSLSMMHNADKELPMLPDSSSNSTPALLGAPPPLILRNDRVRGGTLRALVNWLLDDYLSLEFEMRTFLLAFRLFTSPRQVVIELGTHSAKHAVTHFSTLWINSFWDHADDPMLPILSEFVDQSLVSERKHLDSRSGKQLKITLLQPEDTDITGERSASQNASRTASTTSLHGTMPRNPSLTQQLGTQFGNYSALNLASFGLSGRRASRQASITTIDDANGERTNSTVTSEELLTRAPIDIASQITVMWYEIFQNVQASELLDQRFSSSKKHLGLAPNVTKLVESSNYLTALVGDTILAGDLSVKQRARILKHWIRVAHEMHVIGNLNGAVTVVLTLQSTSIIRLSKVWESLSSKTQTMLAKILPITSPDRNFAEYRREFKRKLADDSFCVPYLGTLLGDLTLIDEGNPKLLTNESETSNSDGEPLINFDRYLKASKAIAQIQHFQVHHLDIPADPAMQAWIRSQSVLSHTKETKDSDDHWRRSLLIQPQL